MAKPPAKTWRVTVHTEDPIVKGFRGQSEAYKYVHEMVPHGYRIVVHKWENGRWMLFEVFAVYL